MPSHFKDLQHVRWVLLSIFVLVLLSRPQSGHAADSAVLPATRPGLIDGDVSWSKLIASDPDHNEQFGASVSISADGNTALVGAPREGNNGYEYGAAYIYIRVATGWRQQAKLTVPDRATHLDRELFGLAVALSADGNTAVIGTPNEDTLDINGGAVYIFIREGDKWKQQAKFFAQDDASNNYFGGAVAVSADGNLALIGSLSYQGAGAVYVFTRNNTVWTQQAKFQNTDNSRYDSFGYSVALNADGSTALVGATRHQDALGAAYIFTRTGQTWTQQAKLPPSGINGILKVGVSVALSASGDTALIGTQNVNGVALVYTRTSGIWTQQAIIGPGLAVPYDFFGGTVALSADGNIALIGAQHHSDTDTSANGTAYLLVREGDSWVLRNTFIAFDKASGDYFGGAVALSANGKIALIGAPYDYHSDREFVGSAYVFSETLITPTPTGTPALARTDTIGVYKAGWWYLRHSNTTGTHDFFAVFGGDPTDWPIVGDWNGDGVDTIGIYRSSTGFFYLSESNINPTVNYSVLLGNPGDMPLAGKWRLDMSGDSIGVFRPTNGILYQKRQLLSGVSDYFAVFGNPSDTAFAGDWNDDGKDSIGIYRYTNAQWSMTNNSEPNGITATDIGYVWSIGANAIPVVGDWNGDGQHNIGYLQTAEGMFTLNTDGNLNSFAYGPTDGIPVAGKWTAAVPVPPLSAVRGVIVGNGGSNAGGGEGGAD
jgi:hypothetical protein